MSIERMLFILQVSILSEQTINYAAADFGGTRGKSA